MLDTIDALAYIGADAALRHAPSEQLLNVLHDVDASDTLKAAVLHADSSLLSDEFGDESRFVPQITQGFFPPA